MHRGQVKNRSSYVRVVVLWGLWIILAGGALLNAYQIQTYYNSISCRYYTSISEEKAVEARRYAVEQQQNNFLWPTYWTQSNAKITTELQSWSGVCLWYSGEGTLVWPAKFVSGNYPGELSENGSCISTELSWQLYGTFDSVGQKLSVNGKTFRIYGVFQYEDSFALFSCGNTTPEIGWTAVEYPIEKQGIPRAFITSFLKASGLGIPDAIIEGKAFANLSFIIAASSSLTMLAFFGVKLLGIVSKIEKSKKAFFLFVTITILAIALPTILSYLPQEFIPNQWSDFSFWGQLYDTLLSRLKDWFALYPTIADVQVKLLILQEIGYSVIGIIISLFLCLFSEYPSFAKTFHN